MAYFERFIGLDHVVEGVDGEVAVVVGGLGVSAVPHVDLPQVDVNHLLNLSAGTLHLEVAFVDLVDHLPVKEMVLALSVLEGVFVENRLRILPDGLLDVLTDALLTCLSPKVR